MNYLNKATNTINRIKEKLDLGMIDPEKMNIYTAIMYNLAVMRTKIMTWIDNGEKTFVLTKNLVEAFTHTDIPWSLAPNNFHYPFETFLVEAQDFLFKTNFEGYEERNVYGILFIDNKVVLRDPTIKWGDVNGIQMTKPDWDISLTGLFTNPNDDLECIMMHMKEDETLEKSATTRKSGPFIMPIEEKDVRNLANIFFNTVLYINDPTRLSMETEVHKSRSVKNHTDNTFHEQKYIVLSPPKSYKSLGKSGKKIDKRFIVRGHWWPKLSNTESQKPRRWVKPFLKGPEISELISHPYKVK
jgi:hypothetical protein